MVSDTLNSKQLSGGQTFDPKKNLQNPEEVTDVIGGSGKWQMFIFSIAFATKFLGAFHNFAGTFTAPKVDHWCAQPDQGPWANLTHDDWRNVTRKCGRPTDKAYHDLWVANGSTVTQFCDKWEYDHSVFASTITEKWDLVCDYSWMTSMLKTVYMLGFLSACLVMGNLADKFGRRPVLIVSGIIFIVAAITNAFAPNYAIFAITRFFVAFGRTGAMNASYILTMEVFGNKQRPVVGTMAKIGFVLGYMSLPGIAYFLRDWFELQLTITAPVVLLFLVCLIAPESPRWLITNERYEEAAKVLAKAASWNGLVLQNPENTVKILASKIKKNTGAKGFRIFMVLKSPNMRKKSLILFFQWFVVAFVFYGLSFNAGDLGGNLFINFAIFGACQIPGNFLSIYTMNKLGRRTTISGGMIIAGLASFCAIPFTNNLLWVRITLATIAMSFISGCFNGSYIFSSEIFPTEVRSVGLTSASVFARFGSMTSPFMKELGAWNDFMIPLGIFGVLSLTTGLTILMLPETKGEALLETVEQGELFTRNNGSVKKKEDENENGEIDNPIFTLTSFPKPNDNN